LAVRYVINHPRNPVHFAGLVRDREGAIAHPADLAVGPYDSVLEVIVASGLNRRRCVNQSLVIFGVNSVEPCARHLGESPTRSAPYLFIRRADVDQFVVAGFGYPKNFADILSDLSKPFFAASERALCLLAGGDVGCNTEHLIRRAVGRNDGALDGLQPSDPARAVRNALFRDELLL